MQYRLGSSPTSPMALAAPERKGLLLRAASGRGDCGVNLADDYVRLLPKRAPVR